MRHEGGAELADNVVCLTHQFVARLIQKSKTKGNKLVTAKIRTETSIPIEVYAA
jgi:hypothetical protein